jgi:hypothetical protein
LTNPSARSRFAVGESLSLDDPLEPFGEERPLACAERSNLTSVSTECDCLRDDASRRCHTRIVSVSEDLVEHSVKYGVGEAAIALGDGPCEDGQDCSASRCMDELDSVLLAAPESSGERYSMHALCEELDSRLRSR